jgi:hypothetical protein
MSRLLDHGPHSVVIYPEEEFQDTYNNIIRRPSETGVTITGCLVVPIAGSRAPGSDRRVGAEMFRFLARTAPLGKWSRVEWEGRRLTVESGPDEYRMSSGVRHVSAVLIAEG